MIKKLRRKFILLSAISLFVLLLIIVITSNLLSYNTLRDNADRVLETIVESERHKDAKPEKRNFNDEDSGINQRYSGEIPQNSDFILEESKLPRNPFSRDLFLDNLSESRYFMVALNELGEMEAASLDFITSISEDEAAEMAENAIDINKAKGFIDNYRFLIVEGKKGSDIIDEMQDDDGFQDEGRFQNKMVFFLDCSKNLSTFKSSLLTSSLISLAGFLLVCLGLIILSGRIIRPFLEADKKQKQFISMAGHEIKTPLTIIDADSELLRMEIGEDNEWLEDISLQTKRLTNLTKDLLSLSKMDEQEKRSDMLDFPMSDVVSETLQSFQNLARKEGLEIEEHITPMLSFFGNEKEIRQLIGALLDNAIKYSIKGKDISLALEQKGNNILLSVANYSEHVTKEQAECFFDRFYRTEQSERSQKGGYGLGLAIAKAIVENHQGKIWADVAPAGQSGAVLVKITASFSRRG